MTEKLKKITKNQKAIFFIVSFLFVSAMFLYLFFISQVAVNVAERSNIEKELSVLNTEISQLEFEYIELKNSVDIELAYSLGFREVEQLEFINRRPLGQANSSVSVQ